MPPLPDAEALGLTAAQRAAFEALRLPRTLPARVASESKGELRVWCAQQEHAATCAGRMLANADGRGELPAVGDWVALEVLTDGRGIVHALLPRTTVFSRKAAGRDGGEQVVAANIDVVFVAMGLDGDFNLRRVERYLAVAWESGAEPVVVLTKRDLCDDADARAAEVRAVAGRAEVLVTSAKDHIGVDALERWLTARRTGAILGSSGAGKSTLANALLGREALRTGEVRAHDQRGQHTTTRRELVVLSSGAMLIDTPGMRELQLWDVSRGLDAAFEDIVTVAARCRFRDCTHGAEPGCAVREALAEGALDRARYASWEKLRDEAARSAKARRVRERGRR